MPENKPRHAREPVPQTFDVCEYGGLPADDPRALACDYGGLYETHYCCGGGSWGPDVLAALSAARSVAELRAAWAPLEARSAVDGFGGSEYHHALAHLRAVLAAGGVPELGEDGHVHPVPWLN